MAIPKTPITRFRLQTYPDLATAMASTKVFGYGDIICIIGDTTRFKLGFGFTNSAKNPAVITGKTFANLPWVNGQVGSAVAGTLNATGTLTAALIAGKYVTTTSAAAVTATLDTIANIVSQFGSVQGTKIPFTIDNLAGANTLTVAVVTGITVPTAVLTGADTLTVAAGKVGDFVLIIKDATHALLIRTL